MHLFSSAMIPVSLILRICQEFQRCLSQAGENMAVSARGKITMKPMGTPLNGCLQEWTVSAAVGNADTEIIAKSRLHVLKISLLRMSKKR